MSFSTPPSPRRAFLLALGAGASLLTGGCLERGLPLPPPGAPDLDPPDSTGMVYLRGRVEPYATVFAENLRNGDVVGRRTGDSGEYELSLRAQVDDNIALWYRVGTEESTSLLLTVPAQDDALSGLGGAGD